MSTQLLLIVLTLALFRLFILKRAATSITEFSRSPSLSSSLPFLSWPCRLSLRLLLFCVVVATLALFSTHQNVKAGKKARRNRMREKMSMIEAGRAYACLAVAEGRSFEVSVAEGIARSCGCASLFSLSL